MVCGAFEIGCGCGTGWDPLEARLDLGFLEVGGHLSHPPRHQPPPLPKMHSYQSKCVCDLKFTRMDATTLRINTV